MNPTEIGMWVRGLRKSQGMTLEELAFRTGVTPGALSHIENGRRLPSPHVAASLAGALRQPAEDALQLLDADHGDRRRETLNDETRSSQRSSGETSAGFWAKRDVGELFGEPASQSVMAPSMRSMPRDVTPMRDAARWSPEADSRLRALEQLADTAADAIRTLRGMVEDEDPMVRREARRLLRELDVRPPEE